MAVVSSCRKTAGDKPEEGEDDVKSSCPLRPGRHTCYNGRDKGSRSREGELTPKTRPQFGFHTAVNSFPGLVHTARHTMGAGHARSPYLNRKEGDAEGRVSDWSEVVTRSEQVDRSSFFHPHVAPVWRHGGEKRKERDGVSLAFDIAGPNGRPARRAISSVVERAPDNCVVVSGL
ncbi:hypothetical protein VNO77_47972 [Canavalia gladiata]|uniref:Uncharacterized protein n=1 Tax=Canavalia gladiata TaxID=3824 RepID=A0AAN9PGI7_CANGL